MLRSAGTRRAGIPACAACRIGQTSCRGGTSDAYQAPLPRGPGAARGGPL